jgi:phosphoribosylaminoimidazolecarboxamide formyltransferase/IMP cyclohydrolase
MITPEKHVISKAIISVSDKTGIVEFAKELNQLGIEIFSTGGTSKLLRDSGIPVKSISDLTGFPEILDSRVKTTHPVVLAGLLAQLDKEEHLKQLAEHHISSLDLLVVNLYPFEETLEKEDSTHEDIIENIDIGGPTMIRAAAKNYLWTVVVVNPKRYDEILNCLKENNKTIPVKLRTELAGEVFSHTAYYDSLISSYFDKINKIEMPEKKTIGMKIQQTLRYGENPHQKAQLYGSFFKIFKQLHGKELSYNNIIDIDAASRLILEFDETAVAIIKHTNPSGAAVAESLPEAYQKAFATDTVSPFGGIIVVNRRLDKIMAETVHSLFTELIIAPEFTDEALQILMKKRDRRLIVADYEKLKNSLGMEIKSVSGGFLTQTTDLKLYDENNLKVVSNRKPTEREMAALKFGWKIVKHVKSNAIVYSAGDRTLAIGAGQMSRVDSSRIAIEKAKLMGIDLQGSVMASDAYFPFADSVMMAVEAGATAVIQPGGSVRDGEVIAAADEHNIAMVLTGMRHFRH